jgi:outer membrane lipopolysaccharide assembly protein LptE/RlpB
VYYRLILIALSLTMTWLSGCGFRLQGSNKYPGINCVLPTIQLEQPIAYGNFYRHFYALCKQRDVIVLSRQIESSALPPHTIRLRLSEPQWNERSLSYSSDGQTNYIMLELTLKYAVVDPTGTENPTQAIVLARPMSVSLNGFLNNDSQRDLVKDALIQKACAQLLQQLGI